MKIAIINGSPRKNGATSKILKAFKLRLDEKNSVETNYIDLADYSLKNCSGCENCYKTGTCHLKDQAEEINQIVSQSDGVIIGTPTYVSNVSGILKNYIDRAHIVVEQSLKGKYMFAVTSYEIAGGSSVIKMLNNMFCFAGGISSGNYSLKLAHNGNPFEKTKVLKQIHRKADKYYGKILKSGHKGLFSRIINFIALHMVMKPSVLRSPERYQAVLNRWRAIGVINNLRNEK